MSCQQFEAVVNHSAEFKAIASYLLITPHPTYHGLNEYGSKVLKKEYFEFWRTLSTYEKSDRVVSGDGYNDLKGFFAFLGISDMDSFIYDPDGQKIWTLLCMYGSGELRIYNGKAYITHRWTDNYTKLFLDNPGGTSNSYDTNKFGDLCLVKNGVLIDFDRIDLKINGAWQTGVVMTNNTFQYTEYFDYYRLEI